MDAAYASGEQLYWLNGEPNDMLLNYPNNTGTQTFWLAGEPSDILTPFFNKESMFEIF